MERRSTFSRNAKGIAVVAIIGFAFAALFYKLDGEGAQECNFLNGVAWVVLEISRPVILAGWQTMQMCLTQNSRFLQLLPQIVASVCPLLCTVAG